MKITKGLVPLNKKVESIRVLHSSNFNSDGFVAEMVAEGKNVQVHKKDGRTERFHGKEKMNIKR